MEDTSIYGPHTEWRTLDGRTIPIRCLSDTHLANIIRWVSGWEQDELKAHLVEALTTEAKTRGLTDEFISRAPIPWQDVDGKWKAGPENGEREYRVIGR